MKFKVTVDSKNSVLKLTETYGNGALDYGMNLVGVKLMWEKGFKGKEIKVAILDTGLEFDHPEFEGKKFAYKDIALPGVEILSTFIGHKYARLSGTSMATPYFSGCVALIIEEFKSKNGRKPTQDELKSIVVDKAIDLGEIGLDEQFGYGLFSFNNYLLIF